MPKIELSIHVRDVLREILGLHSSIDLKEIGAQEGYIVITPKAFASFVRKARRDSRTLERFEYLLNEIGSNGSQIIV